MYHVLFTIFKYSLILMKNKYQPLDFLVVKSIKIIASYINFQNIHFTNLTIKFMIWEVGMDKS